ncbi:DUF6221 family protein [Nocardia farcinica]|uniref:DUF6221 family protein n=1 Tax=Nocardia farcinica TaxID=37329 RepID=UPI0018934AE0|nr:DUF6221 family protein [Nocardia farcinica]MBF6374481.1 hypothetical protein [Nocardia farcinica]
MRIEEFIEARLAEDESAARKAADFPYDAPSDAPWVSMQLRVRRGVAMTSDEHIARHDPARVLRQVAALRATLEHVERMVSPSQQIEAEEDVLYPIAAIWSDHPDYQPEWAA